MISMTATKIFVLQIITVLQEKNGSRFGRRNVQALNEKKNKFITRTTLAMVTPKPTMGF